MIAIIDYGMGNLGSVEKAFSYLGYETRITASAEDVMAASGVVLPGVGAIGPAMTAIRGMKMNQIIADYLATGRPFLGICLGMQLLFDSSEEGDEEVSGLGILPGKVRRFPASSGLKIPQIGWNRLTDVKHAAFTEGQYVYFVHSFYCDAENEAHTAATAEYGICYTAAVSSGNLLAAQFHPEKSGAAGLSILRKWADSNGSARNL